MKIIIDKIHNDPPHSLTTKDVKSLNKFIIEKFDFKIKNFRLSGELPKTSRFNRPVIYSGYSDRMNVSSRGVEKEIIIKEMFLEMLQLRGSSIMGSPVYSRYANDFTTNDRKKLNGIIDQIYQEYQNQV